MARKKYILKIIPNDKKVIEEDKESEDFVIYLSNLVLSYFEELYNKPQGEIYKDVADRINYTDEGFEVIYRFNEIVDILDYLMQFIDDGNITTFIMTLASSDPKIILAYNPKEKAFGGYRYHTQDIEIIFKNNLVNNIIQNKKDKQIYVDNLLYLIKNSLTHELIHLYDNSVSNFKIFEAGKPIESIYKKELDKLTKYFEINSYYVSAKQITNEQIHKNMTFDEYHSIFLQNLSMYYLLPDNRKAHISGRILKEWEQEIDRLRGEDV